MSQESRIISFIKSARVVLGWSQADLAEQSGVSLVAIARLESGVVSPRLSTIVKIKDALSRAGVRAIDDQPEGGYTMVVSESAVEVSAQSAVLKRSEKSRVNVSA